MEHRLKQTVSSDHRHTYNIPIKALANPHRQTYFLSWQCECHTVRPRSSYLGSEWEVEELIKKHKERIGNEAVADTQKD